MITVYKTMLDDTEKNILVFTKKVCYRRMAYV